MVSGRRALLGRLITTSKVAWRAEGIRISTTNSRAMPKFRKLWCEVREKERRW
jgi:hypothetical protein